MVERDDTAKPEWFLIGDKILFPVLGMAIRAVDSYWRDDVSVHAVGYLAACHALQAVRTSLWANEHGHHSVAMSLLRQAMEASVVMEVALQERDLSRPVVTEWVEGKHSAGELRACL